MIRVCLVFDLDDEEEYSDGFEEERSFSPSPSSPSSPSSSSSPSKVAAQFSRRMAAGSSPSRNHLSFQQQQMMKGSPLLQRKRSKLEMFSQRLISQNIPETSSGKHHPDKPRQEKQESEEKEAKAAIFCVSCGFKNFIGGAKFCTNCGGKLEIPRRPAPAVPAETPAVAEREEEVEEEEETEDELVTPDAQVCEQCSAERKAQIGKVGLSPFCTECGNRWPVLG